MIAELLEKVSELFSKYYGDVVINDKEIKIVSDNNLLDLRDNQSKLVECSVIVGSLGSEKYPFFCDAFEKTHCIIGGVGRPCCSIDEAIEAARYELDHYKFRRRAFEQLTLF